MALAKYERLNSLHSHILYCYSISTAFTLVKDAFSPATKLFVTLSAASYWEGDVIQGTVTVVCLFLSSVHSTSLHASPFSLLPRHLPFSFSSSFTFSPSSTIINHSYKMSTVVPYTAEVGVKLKGYEV